jgi:predicted RNA-binding Zn ribbon-like protein
MTEKYDHRLPNRAGSLHLLGGNLALNFANTESGRNGPQHLNHIQTAADIVTWARHAEVIDETVAIRESDSRLFPEGQTLRQAIYEINSALAAGKTPLPEFTQILAKAHGKTLRSATLIARNGKYLWAWQPTEDPADAILGPIAQAALALLMQQDHKRIKQCRGNHCGWLFYDSTKNNSRRWCDMSVCGNRSKIKALRKRREKQEPLT